MAKMAPCCNRHHYQVESDRAEIARLARVASRHHAKGQNISSLQKRIAAGKLELARHEAALVDHEAEHAEDLAVSA
jgi:hypothetical protein